MKDGLGTNVTQVLQQDFVVAVASNPVDVIRTRVLNMIVEAIPPYNEALDCAFKTLKAKVPMALSRVFFFFFFNKDTVGKKRTKIL